MADSENRARSVTFLHVADIHMGAPLRGLGNVDDEWGLRLARAIPASYNRAIDVAIARKVDFVVFAGDSFDTSRTSYAEFLHFFDGLNRLDEAGIPAYLVAGNHDPYTMWGAGMSRLPASAKLLGVDGPEYLLHCRDDEPLCIIAGRSYYNQTWPADRRIADKLTRGHAIAALGTDAPFAVGVIHTGLDLDQNKAPADIDELLGAGLDYWACGHLHLRTVRPSKADPRIVSPGCIQGRDVKETGERGCYLVTLEEADNSAGFLAGAAMRRLASVHLEFQPLSSVVLEQVQVDVSACRTLSDLVRHVAASLFKENGKIHCDEMVTRITLVGETQLHRFLVKPEVISDLRKQINDAYPTFFCDALIDRTAARLDDDARGRHPFHRVLASMAEEQRAREETLVNYVQSEFVKRGIAVPASLTRRVGDFNDAAESLVLDLLQEEDE